MGGPEESCPSHKSKKKRKKRSGRLHMESITARIIKEKKRRENNPWAICTSQVGRSDPAKYERCVKQVKGQQ